MKANPTRNPEAPPSRAAAQRRGDDQPRFQKRQGGVGGRRRTSVARDKRGATGFLGAPARADRRGRGRRRRAAAKSVAVAGLDGRSDKGEAATAGAGQRAKSRG